MNRKKKIEIIINCAVILLSVVNAVMFFISGSAFAAWGFTVIALLNIFALLLRVKREG
ncbi:MAG: hypothetical protein GX061_08970 [Eubacteriaceae bacterium]|nr:hypothetical protein [Eubacteriaceae bacterium]